MGVIMFLLLTGEHPFFPEEMARRSPKKLFHRIRNSDPRPEPLSSMPSAQSQDLVQLLLQKDSSKRPTAQEALAHPYFKMTLLRDTSPPNFAAMKNMVNFFRMEKMERVLLTVAAHEAHHHEVKALQRCFQELDIDGSGELSKDEMRKAFFDHKLMSSESITIRGLSALTELEGGGTSVTPTGSGYSVSPSVTGAVTDGVGGASTVSAKKGLPNRTISEETTPHQAPPVSERVSRVSEVSSNTSRTSVISEAIFEQMWDVLDADHSGVISYTEFLSACLEQKNIESDCAMTRAFEYFDLDGNGTINKDELMAVLGEEEGAKAFRRLDVDQSGEVDFTEFKRFCHQCAEKLAGEY